MKKKDYLPILGYAAFYVVTIFATAFLGYLFPLCMGVFSSYCSLAGGFLVLFGCREKTFTKNLPFYLQFMMLFTKVSYL